MQYFLFSSVCSQWFSRPHYLPLSSWSICHESSQTVASSITSSHGNLPVSTYTPYLVPTRDDCACLKEFMFPHQSTSTHKSTKKEKIERFL